MYVDSAGCVCFCFPGMRWEEAVAVCESHEGYAAIVTAFAKKRPPPTFWHHLVLCRYTGRVCSRIGAGRDGELIRKTFARYTERYIPDAIDRFLFRALLNLQVWIGV